MTSNGWNISHVSVIGDIWPVLFEDGGSVGVDFREPDGLETFRFKGETETSDAAEKVKVSWFGFIHSAFKMFSHSQF